MWPHIGYAFDEFAVVSWVENDIWYLQLVWLCQCVSSLKYCLVQTHVGFLCHPFLVGKFHGHALSLEDQDEDERDDKEEEKELECWDQDAGVVELVKATLNWGYGDLC